MSVFVISPTANACLVYLLNRKLGFFRGDYVSRTGTVNQLQVEYLGSDNFSLAIPSKLVSSTEQPLRSAEVYPSELIFVVDDFDGDHNNDLAVTATGLQGAILFTQRNTPILNTNKPAKP